MSLEPSKAGADEPPMGTSESTSLPGVALEGVIEPVVATMGYELVHVEWTQSGRHAKMQVFVDHPDGVGLDDCTRLSPIIGNALDAAEADPEGSRQVHRLLDRSYTLEVSSPGLDRPLSRRSHFEKFAGQRATIRLMAPVSEGSSQRNFHGHIGRTEPDPAAPQDDRRGFVELTADEGTVHRLSLALVRRANLIYEG